MSGTTSHVRAFANRGVMSRSNKWLGLVLTALVLVACGREPTVEEPVQRASLALSTYAVSFPNGATGAALAVVAGGSLALEDRVVLRDPGGTRVGAANTGSTESRVGVEASLGDVISLAPVRIKERAVVRDVTSSGAIQLDNQVTMRTLRPQDPNLVPLETRSISIEFAGTGPNVVLEPPSGAVDRITELAPGRYGRLAAKSRNRIHLRSGEYLVDSLELEPDASLVVDDSGGPVFLNVRDHFVYKGVLRAEGGHHPHVQLVYAGTPPVVLETAFAGTLFAPRASVRLASLPAGRFHAGSFWAKDVTVSPDVVVEYRPFVACDDAQECPVGKICVNESDCVPTPNTAASVALGDRPSIASSTPIEPFSVGTSPSPALSLHPGSGAAFSVVPVVGNFAVQFTLLTVGTDGDFANRDLDARVYINGEHAGDQHVYDDDCVKPIGDCPGGVQLAKTNRFEAPVRSDQPTVSVRVILIERDESSGDETVLDRTFTIDNQAETPEVCATGNDQWGICFTTERTSPPTVAVEPRVCATWATSFIDDALGEDDATGGRVPARFVFAQLSIIGPFGSDGAARHLDADGCFPLGVIEPQAYAFVHGADPGESGGLMLQLQLYPEGSASWLGLQRPDGIAYQIESEELTGPISFSTFIEGEVPLSSWTKDRGWSIPPARIDVANAVLHPVTNVAATLGTILARDDMGYTPDDPTTPDVNEGLYKVIQGVGYVFAAANGTTYVDSVASGGTLFVGPAVVPPAPATCSAASPACPNGFECRTAPASPVTPVLDANGFATGFGRVSSSPCTEGAAACICMIADQSRWKFVTSHEAGHQIQGRAIGVAPGGGYDFACPPGVACTGARSDRGVANYLNDPWYVNNAEPLCGCQHVTAANGLHCLQSIEIGAKAFAEGFAHFLAARAWNRADESDCTFVYYKDVLGTECRPGSPCAPYSGNSAFLLQPPPAAFDCAAPQKWRNRSCPRPEHAIMGTELDWMTFLYALNTSGAQRMPMPDIFAAHKNACRIPPPANTPPDPNPEQCTRSVPIGWSMVSPVSVMPATTCRVDADCCALGNQNCVNVLCFDDAPGSTAGCTDHTCECKEVPQFGFLQGAQAAFGVLADRVTRLTSLADLHGVGEDLAP